MTNSYEASGFYTKSIENNFDAPRLYENISLLHGVSICYNNIGVNNLCQLQYDKAIKSYCKSLEIDCRLAILKNALAFYKTYTLYKDPIFNDENKQQLPPWKMKSMLPRKISKLHTGLRSQAPGLLGCLVHLLYRGNKAQVNPGLPR